MLPETTSGGQDKEIEGITKSCLGCSMSQPDPVKAPLNPWQWPDRPWQRIHIDYAGPFLGSMFLIIVDAHSKWAEVFPTSSTTYAATVRMLSETFARFGVPDGVLNDNGPQFTSDEFKTFVKINGIRQTISTPYHPSTNGLAERFVQSFKQAMKSAKHDKGTLHTKLARFLFAYRNAPHSTTNETPAVLMFGRKLRSHLNILRPSTSSAVAQQRQADTRPPAHPHQLQHWRQSSRPRLSRPTTLAPWNSLCQYRPIKLSSGNRSWRALAQTC